VCLVYLSVLVLELGEVGLVGLGVEVEEVAHDARLGQHKHTTTSTTGETALHITPHEGSHLAYRTPHAWPPEQRRPAPPGSSLL
jgi:hypothetical protein